MKKCLVLIFVLPSIAMGIACPQYTYPQIPGLDQDMNNICHNISNPVLNSVSGIPLGKIVQYITSTNSSNTATLSTSYVSTALTANITPMYSTSHILILASGELVATDSGGDAQAALFNGTTNLFGGTTAMCDAHSSGGSSYGGCTMIWMDFPASTTPQTYTVKVRDTNAASQAIWGTSTEQFIILVEVTP